MKSSVIKNTNIKTREPDVQATRRISQIVEDHASPGFLSLWYDRRHIGVPKEKNGQFLTTVNHV